MTVLVTGGMGYIGSHTCVELLEQGMDVVVIDNLVNSSEKAKERIEEITGNALTFYKADVRDRKSSTRYSPHTISTALSTLPGLKPSASRWKSRLNITTTTSARR